MAHDLRGGEGGAEEGDNSSVEPPTTLSPGLLFVPLWARIALLFLYTRIRGEPSV